MSTKGHERKRHSVYLSVSKNSCIAYVWKQFNFIWWTISDESIKEEKIHTKSTSLTRVHIHYLISLGAPKLLTKKNRNKESVASRLMTKSKLMQYFFHNPSQFSNVTENKPCLSKAFHDSKRREKTHTLQIIHRKTRKILVKNILKNPLNL